MSDEGRVAGIGATALAGCRVDSSPEFIPKHRPSEQRIDCPIERTGDPYGDPGACPGESPCYSHQRIDDHYGPDTDWAERVALCAGRARAVR